ncbi:MAG TPA: class I SAM-dependent methyltransferase [Gaiellaceae bacterium]|nr:class I SAM-dependent methyltransferase [Gaiellaceae bacterium]
MSARQAPADVLRRDELVERDGILHRADASDASDYRRRWEDEAAEDHVRSAIAADTTGPIDLAALTAKTSSLWDRVPQGSHFETVLELGAGYGRIPLYLATERRCTWSTYCAIDISENMLRRFVEYDERFGRNPEADLHPIRASADALPLEDGSVDLALTSAVFLHMGKSFVERAVAEVARTLKPGGAFVFDVSFPNARNPLSWPPRLKPRRLRPPHFMKYWRREEVEELLVDTGLAAKAGGFSLEPVDFRLLPKRLGPLPVPLAERVNAAVGPSPRRFRDVLGTRFNTYSTGLLDTRTTLAR